MSYSVVEEKLHTIPEEYLPQIMEYLSLLEYKIMYENMSSVSTKENTNSKKHPEKQHRIPGTLKGKISMADDFDAPLECFKEYM